MDNHTYQHCATPHLDFCAIGVKLDKDQDWEALVHLGKSIYEHTGSDETVYIITNSKMQELLRQMMTTIIDAEVFPNES